MHDHCMMRAVVRVPMVMVSRMSHNWAATAVVSIVVVGKRQRRLLDDLRWLIDHDYLLAGLLGFWLLWLLLFRS